MLKRCISNKTGMALPLVLMVMVVFSILGVTLLSVANAEINNSMRQQKKLQAHCIAKSGLEAVIKNFLKNPKQLKTALEAGNPITGEIKSGVPGYQVNLTGSIGDIVTIKSTASVGNVKEVVSLEVDTAIEPNSVFLNSIYSTSALDVSKMNVTGDLQSGGTVTAPAGYSGTITNNTPIAVEVNTFPTALPLNVNNTIANKATLLVNKSTEFSSPSLSINNGGTLRIDTGEEETTIIEIVVDTLDIKGILEIAGSGTVILYVKELMEMQASGSINYGSSIDPSKLLVILAENSNFNIKAKINFGGYILGPKASVNVGSANVTIKGSMMCNNFTQANNSTIVFVPPTEIPPSILGGVVYSATKTLYKD
jgi:type II secretory pathway pseudopilin PulG